VKAHAGRAQHEQAEVASMNQLAVRGHQSMTPRSRV
jgi:hypothetical protein